MIFQSINALIILASDQVTKTYVIALYDSLFTLSEDSGYDVWKVRPATII